MGNHKLSSSIIIAAAAIAAMFILLLIISHISDNKIEAAQVTTETVVAKAAWVSDEEVELGIDSNILYFYATIDAECTDVHVVNARNNAFIATLYNDGGAFHVGDVSADDNVYSGYVSLTPNNIGTFQYKVVWMEGDTQMESNLIPVTITKVSESESDFDINAEDIYGSAGVSIPDILGGGDGESGWTDEIEDDAYESVYVEASRMADSFMNGL